MTGFALSIEIYRLILTEPLLAIGFGCLVACRGQI